MQPTSRPHDLPPSRAYKAPWWLPGGHAQTIYASILLPRPALAYRRERWETPDGDFIDLDWTRESGIGNGESEITPLVALFHGLEGSSNSHYALSLMDTAAKRGLRGVVVHFRGCGGEPNRLARAYHSGDAAEIDWLVKRLKTRNAGAPLHAVGISLGGNALLKWLGETGADAANVVERAAAVSAPLDLMAAGAALGRGFCLVYTHNFLRTLKAKSLAKLERFPGLYDAARVRAASTLRQFDDLVTAPLHGFRDTDDYWTRASSLPWLKSIRVPTLVVNARNDPFLPATALPGPADVPDAVTLEQPEEGGHVGFVGGGFPGDFSWLPQRVLRFLLDRQ